MTEPGQPPVPFEPHSSGAWLHGTKADLAVGNLLVAGYVVGHTAEQVQGMRDGLAAPALRGDAVIHG